MGKSLSRDIQVLLKILAYIEKVKNILKKYNCKSSADFIANEDCMDICNSNSFLQVKNRIKYCQENK